MRPYSNLLSPIIYKPVAIKQMKSFKSTVATLTLATVFAGQAATLPLMPAEFANMPSHELAGTCYGTLYRAGQLNEQASRQASGRRVEDLQAYAITYAVASQIAIVRALRAAAEVPQSILAKVTKANPADIQRQAVFCSQWASSEFERMPPSERNTAKVRMEEMFNQVTQTRIQRRK